MNLTIHMKELCQPKKVTIKKLLLKLLVNQGTLQAITSQPAIN